ncbi:MAG TPA: c-type cytochrome [Candidatus Baltobacteraceae bacterium]|nr:c-type cytochrome [Candidatus Baltobacteraceae bacterium]
MRTRLLVSALIVAGIAVVVVLGSQALLQRELAPQPGAPAARLLWEHHCTVCHGSAGKGDGPGAKVTGQHIEDFTNPQALRGVTDQFLFEIIQKGGSQFGRSSAMPAWGMQLRDEQIRSLVTYIRSLPSVPPAQPGRKETP